MARIRTIKPEFPQSESMGRVSREARLFFILLWTFVDDSGRGRGHSRVLASHLFPFDEDSPSLIDGWVEELEREDCVVRYEVGGTTYIQVTHWSHQKIDKPTVSRLPPISAGKVITKAAIRESSANPRESSRVVENSPPPYLVPSIVVPSTEDLVPTATQTEKVPSAAIANSTSPLDLKKEYFVRGVAYLKTCGLEERDARSMLGKWRRDHGEVATLMALASAEGAAVSEPIPYIQKILRNATNGKPNNHNQPISDHPLGIFGQLGDEISQTGASDGQADRAKAVN